MAAKAAAEAAAHREEPDVSTKPNSSASENTENEAVRKDSGLIVQGRFPDVWKEELLLEKEKKAVDEKGRLIRKNSGLLKQVKYPDCWVRVSSSTSSDSEDLQSVPQKNASKAKAQESSSDAD